MANILIMSDQQIIFSMNRVNKTFPSNNKQVLKDIHLSFFYGAKIGIIGLNGSGKSTLLKIIAGLDKSFQGDIHFSKEHTIGYLAQEPEMDDSKTVMDIVKEGMQEAVDLIAEYNNINNQFALPEVYEDADKMEKLMVKQGELQDQIDAAEMLVEELQNKKVEPSEISLIRNLHWWTVEYGLVGTVDDPKIYGAGLLSSIGESKNCMTDAVKKLPYSIDAAYQDFDITKQQPQLFVTPDFAYLQEVLEEFANTMAVRKGGWRGLKKLIESKQLGTIELSTGLQVSGVFKRMIQNEDNEVVYFETEGETALSYREKELIGHGIERHINGFRSPLGKLKGINLAIENMGPRDLQAYNFYDGKHIQFEFESGITVEGMNVTGIRNLKSELMLIQFTDCTVKYKDEVLFSPEDGDFDFAVGKDIVSAFAGMADYRSFNVNTHNPSTTTTIKTERSAKQKELIELYEAIRNYRNGETTKFSPDAVFDILKKHHNEDWLLPLEIYELEVERNTTLSKEVFRYLNELKERRPEVSHLIEGGLELLETPEHV